MIVRNEERRLPELLEEARPHVDEVVVVDTGSVDATPTLAQAHGAVVRELHTGDLAQARNLAMDTATGQWLLWLDADERLDANGWAELRRLTTGAPAVYRCWLDNYFGRGGWTATRRVGKLFSRHPGLRWSSAFHESILPSVAAAGLAVRDASLAFHHLETLPPDDSEAKRRRNIERVRGELSAGRDSPGLRRLLALDLYALGDVEAAWQECARGLAQAPGDVHLHEQLGFFLLDQGRLDEAEASFEGSLAIGGALVDRHAGEGLARIAFARGDLDRAEARVQEAAASDPGAQHAINLALIDEARGQPERARPHWAEALRRNPMLLDPRIHGPRLRASTYAVRTPLLPPYFEACVGPESWRERVGDAHGSSRGARGR